jgi:hypothetical protein
MINLIILDTRIAGDHGKCEKGQGSTSSNTASDTGGYSTAWVSSILFLA